MGPNSLFHSSFWLLQQIIAALIGLSLYALTGSYKILFMVVLSFNVGGVTCLLVYADQNKYICVTTGYGVMFSSTFYCFLLVS